MWSKLNIISIHLIRSRIWDTIDDWYINNLAKNQISVVFHSRVICRSVSPKLIELCMETPCLCPWEEHKHGGRKVPEISVLGLLLKRKIVIALEIPDIGINASKIYSDNSSFDLSDTLLGPPFSCHATQKLRNSNVLCYNEKNPVELRHCEMSSSYRVFYLMKLKPQKER